MRPNPMILFDRLYLTMMVIGIVGGAVNWPVIMAAMGKNPAFEARSVFAIGIVIGSLVLGLAINLLLWYFVSRRASNVARWILVVLIAIGLPSTIWNVVGASSLVQQSGAGRAITAINLVLQIVAVTMLFRADSRAWFANRGKVVSADVFS